MSETAPQVKVGIKLKRDEVGYPPFEVEWLWAYPVGDHLFRLDNIPFYSLGTSIDDVVRAVHDADLSGLILRGVEEPSTTSTVRLWVTAPESKEAVRDEFRALGCDSEGAGKRLSIPQSSFAEAMDRIAAGKGAGKWEWEEGVLRC